VSVARQVQQRYSLGIHECLFDLLELELGILRTSLIVMSLIRNVFR